MGSVRNARTLLILNNFDINFLKVFLIINNIVTVNVIGALQFTDLFNKDIYEAFSVSLINI